MPRVISYIYFELQAGRAPEESGVPPVSMRYQAVYDPGLLGGSVT